MLQIKGIRKVYKTGTLVQEALKGVSLSLRDSEFVAILGQSGSGKTTLLNIIGGLDRYNDGDLIINGVSTKRYTDRDWDSYRNHSVGFVFQSYNLIPHQSILKNVELALTIGGIPSAERTGRAKEALVKVGLEEHIHKKPSQLSGGQMQRVAIARALVNDPDILLADEPTGALDSDTSLQVMDLLKEVARDRLVVMVTHNPELAEKYATRIVTLKDGEITSDSDPFEPSDAGESVHKNMGKSSMSLLTSLALSFNNLWTKKARTILVSFAGSIGIIGIAMILAMSNGANQYIRSVEEDSLQDYPLQITDTSFNLTSMYAASMTGGANENGTAVATKDEKEVHEWSAVTNLLSGVTSNDLKSLKSYFDSDECDIQDYVQAIDYSYNVTPRIYKENDKGYRQVNPNNSFEALGFSSERSGNTLMSSFSNGNTFYEIPESDKMFRKGYDLMAGKWPENYNECVVSLTPTGRISDITLYIMGLKDPKELDEMVEAFSEGKDYKPTSGIGSYDYDDFIGMEFKLLPSTALYTYDKKYKVWSDHGKDKKYVSEKLKNAETLKIVGVIQPNSEGGAKTTEYGIGYPASLTKHVIEMAADTNIVKSQLKEPDVNVFTGKRFDDESENNMDMSSLFNVDKDAINKAFDFKNSGLDFSKLDLSGIDFSNLDLSSAINPADLGKLMPGISEKDLEKMLDGVKINMTEDKLRELFNKVLEDYSRYTAGDPRADISKLPSSLVGFLRTDEAIAMIRSDITQYLKDHGDEMISESDLTALAEKYLRGYLAWAIKKGYPITDLSHIRDYVTSEEAQNILSDGLKELKEKLQSSQPTDEEINGWTKQLADAYEKYAEENKLPSASYMLDMFRKYLETDEAKKLIGDVAKEAIDTSGITQSMSGFSKAFSEQMGASMQQIFSSVGSQISSKLEKSMNGLMSGISDNLLNGFNFDTDALADMFKTEMSPEELRDLMVSLMSPQKNTYDSNLRKLGYADIAKPAAITIYPNDFDSKTHIKQIISDYNDRMEKAGEEDKIISYTDLVDALMGSVTTIINAISYVLIAFVAISLVVSSIMIGVITYISVLERRKEIGILRAIGASKRNISQVFNAETFIIGALAGVIGILISQLLILIANPILHSLTGQEGINAILPPLAALILILLSIVLTLIGGIIPSRKAAKSDPVTALRSE